MRRPVAIAAAAFAAALVVSIAAWIVAFAGAAVTGPQPMRWYRADGSPPVVADGRGQSFGGCRLADLQLDTAVWNGGVIVPCRDPALGTGWAFLDPRQRQASLRWPLRDSGETLLSLGLIPGPRRQLAVVFQQAIEGDAFVGIAAADGWSWAPENLGRVRYLAGAWAGNRLELVMVPLAADDPNGLRGAVKIVAFDSGGRHERIAVPGCGKDCRAPLIAYRAGGRWVFEDEGRARAESGESVSPAFPGRTLEDIDLDMVEQGRLHAPVALSFGERNTAGIGADGRPRRAASPPWDGLRVVRQNRFAIDDAPRRRAQWADASLRAITERVGARTLTWYTDDSDRVRVTDAREPAIEAMAALPAVAQWPQRLANRAFVADEAGGFWLVDSAGESIHLDRSLRRTDPLALREHLLASRGPLAVYALAGALFGLPILLVACLGLSLCLRPRRPLLRAGPVAVASALYLLGAGWALLQIAPLL